MLQMHIAILPQSPSCFHFPEIQKKWKTRAKKKKKDDRTKERKRDFKMAGGERAE